MTFQANPEAIPFAVAAAVSGLLAIFAWLRRGPSMAQAFAVTMTGEAVTGQSRIDGYRELLFLEVIRLRMHIK